MEWQGRIQEFGKGGPGNCTKTWRIRLHARDIFPPFMKFGGPPKRGGGALIRPYYPPPPLLDPPLNGTFNRQLSGSSGEMEFELAVPE